MDEHYRKMEGFDEGDETTMVKQSATLAHINKQFLEAITEVGVDNKMAVALAAALGLNLKFIADNPIVSDMVEPAVEVAKATGAFNGMYFVSLVESGIDQRDAIVMAIKHGYCLAGALDVRSDMNG